MLYWDGVWDMLGNERNKTGSLTVLQNITSDYFPAETLEIIQKIKHQSNKAVVFCPSSLNGEIDSILKEFAAKGYLCLYLEPAEEFKFEQTGPNLFSVSHEMHLIPAIKHQSLILYCRDWINESWIHQVPHGFIWLDVTKGSSVPDSIIELADFITYGDPLLARKIPGNKLSLFLPPEQDTMTTIQQVEKRILLNRRSWTLYANEDPTNKAAVMTATFFDYEGITFFSGGAERYLMDLNRIFSELGMKLIIYQYGTYSWMRRFNHLDIISLSRNQVEVQGTWLSIVQQFNRNFYETVQGRSVLNVYSAFNEAWPLAAAPNIGISHGVSWDNPYSRYNNALEFWIVNERFIKGARLCEEVISVDTNTVNWFQTIDYKMGQSMTYIPNYVDTAAFSPREKFDEIKAGDPIVILYPRQLYSARGFYLVLEIVDRILEQYSHVEFHFVGRGADLDTRYLTEKQERWGKRIQWYALQMDEMPQAYRIADIALIPTLFSEGTSLSCLEAMASGNAVIATRIGGLTDLIINGFNGLQIDPNPQALEEAIVSLLEQPEMMIQFKRRGREVACAFAKPIWEKRWRTILQRKLQREDRLRPEQPSEYGETVEIRMEHSPDPHDDRLAELILPFLLAGSLVYVRISGQAANKEWSFGRMQWIGSDEVNYSSCAKVIHYPAGRGGQS